MKIFNDGDRAARADLAAAHRNLEAVPPSDGETPEYLAANRAVVNAEKALPAWKRLDIDLGFNRDAAEEVDQP